MTRMGRIIGFACAALFVSAAGFAGVPSAANSTLPSGIQLVGMSAGGVDVKGEALVIVRDAGNNPYPGTVYIEFENCCDAATPDVRLQPTQPYPGMQWEFGPGLRKPVAYAITDGLARARFRIVGGSTALPGNNAGITTACARVIADGQVLGVLRVGAYDLNSSGGVNAADNSLFLGTLFASPAGYRCRADYNGDGFCNSADLSKILSVQFAAGSGTSGTAMACP